MNKINIVGFLMMVLLFLGLFSYFLIDAHSKGFLADLLIWYTGAAAFFLYIFIALKLMGINILRKK